MVVNYATGHGGHTGVIPAAVEGRDGRCCLGQMVAAVAELGGVPITADHGNPTMLSRTSPNTAHSTNPVPIVTVPEAAPGCEGGIRRSRPPSCTCWAPRRRPR